MPRIDAKFLNKKWSVGARHSLYNIKGTWYHVLQKFPGALFDPNGYVLFDTQLDYDRCPQLKIKRETNTVTVSGGGISSIRGYVRRSP